jgi:hypothetical protein
VVEVPFGNEESRIGNVYCTGSVGTGIGGWTREDGAGLCSSSLERYGRIEQNVTTII